VKFTLLRDDDLPNNSTLWRTYVYTRLAFQLPQVSMVDRGEKAGIARSSARRCCAGTRISRAPVKVKNWS